MELIRYGSGRDTVLSGKVHIGEVCSCLTGIGRHAGVCKKSGYSGKVVWQATVKPCPRHTNRGMFVQSLLHSTR